MALIAIDRAHETHRPVQREVACAVRLRAIIDGVRRPRRRLPHPPPCTRVRTVNP
jgi:hypothetical protein